MIDSIRYALTDDSQGLSVDEEGYFSRPVSTVMLICPIVIDSTNKVVGSRVMAKFEVENSVGKATVVQMFFKIVNYTRRDNWTYFYYSYYPFYNLEEHRANRYSLNDKTTLIAREEGGKHYCMNPAAEKTKKFISTDKAFLDRYGKPKFDVDAIKLQNVKLMKLTDADFSTFDDEDFAALDFSQAVDEVEMADGDVIAFQTPDKRKGLINVSYYYRRFRIQTLYQHIPVE